MKKALVQILDKLIDESEDKAVALQLQIGGQPYAGSVMHSKDHDGIYEMIVVDPHQRIAVSVYFEGESLSAVFVPKEEAKVVGAKRSGIIMPGAH